MCFANKLKYNVPYQRISKRGKKYYSRDIIWPDNLHIMRQLDDESKCFEKLMLERKNNYGGIFKWKC